MLMFKMKAINPIQHVVCSFKKVAGFTDVRRQMTVSHSLAELAAVAGRRLYHFPFVESVTTDAMGMFLFD